LPSIVGSHQSQAAQLGGYEPEHRMPRNHLVLIGSQIAVSGASTHGTGFLVFSRERCYVVTCRHVIREAVGGTLFALPKPKKTKSPSGGCFVLVLGPPRFHPHDSRVGTYDIAVAEVIDVTRSFLAAHDIVPVELTSGQIASTFQEGQRLVAQGYPIDYANTALAANRNELLLPKEIRGTVRRIPLRGIAQYGFDAPLREALFVQTSSENRSGKGMSGGIVHTVGDSRIAGMVLASGDFELPTNSQVLESICGFVFVGSNRILETLTA
jgi:hypothetical protein